MSSSTDTAGRLRFGSFELDVRSRELRRGDRLVRLQEQPFEILRLMLEHPGDVVTRDELRQRLWPDGTFVDFEHSLNAAVKRLRAALGDDADNPRFVETLPRRGYRFIGHSSASDDATDAGGGALPQARLAVLPFIDLSREPSEEYFTDGLTSELIAQLGQRCRGRIGVIARWSCLVFKGTTERAREIGRVLGAQYLLEGSVSREGDRVRISVGLVQAATETHLWAETYERPLTDRLFVQADVAARVAASLAVELVPDAPAAAGPATSVSAYQEYLKGRYYWNQSLRPDDDGADRALACYTEALRIDPAFAPAHAGAARAHVMRALHYRERPRSALEAGRTAAKRALDLDPQLSEAHLALADVRGMLEWDWRGAEAAYLQAIALNPSEENAHRRYGMMLAAVSRLEEAIRETERACEFDPLCLVVNTSAAWTRYLAGDYHGALARCRRATDIDPEYLPAREIVGLVYLQMGNTRDAIAVLEAAHAAGRHDHGLAASIAHAHAVAGDRATAEVRAAALRRRDAGRYCSPFHLALACVGLGDAEAAFAALEQAVTDADPALAYLAVEPRFEPLRADARYGRLLELLCLT